MPLDREYEIAVIEDLKASLLKKFKQSAQFECPDAEMVSAETAQAYAVLVQTQLALEHSR